MPDVAHIPNARAKARIPVSLPLIDVSELKRADLRACRTIVDALGETARTYGFFRICGHGIDPDLIEATYAMAERFFARPEAEKRNYYIGRSPNHRGYVPFSEKGHYADEVQRNYEAFDLGIETPWEDLGSRRGRLLVGPNVWPDIEGFRDVVSRYFTTIAALGLRLCSALEHYLGLPPGAMTGQMTMPISQLRLLHYVRTEGAENHKSVNMGAHTDYECLTLLHTRNPGLQVMTTDDRWIDVPADPEVYVVNIGDMLEAWSNGIFQSTPHRVLNLCPERFSMPYFVAANHDTEIRPFSQLVDKGAQPGYQPFLAGDHIENMLVRDFPYLRERRRKLDLAGLVPLDGTPRNPFERRIPQDNPDDHATR
jgi:isopenicillin N synthase-like dioxygenase